jgi:hypothetical protein
VDVDADSKSSRKSIRLKTVSSLGYSNQTYRLLDSFASSRAMHAMPAEVVHSGGLTTSAGFSHLECSTYLDPLFDCTPSESKRNLRKVRLEYNNLWRVRFLGLKANWAKDKLAPTSVFAYSQVLTNNKEGALGAASPSDAMAVPQDHMRSSGLVRAVLT